MDTLTVLIERDFSELQDCLVMQDGKNYYLYNKYVILPKKSFYKVMSISRTETLEFTSLQAAIGWCVLDYNKRYYDAKKIHRLDLDLQGTLANIIFHKNSVKSKSGSFVALNKLQEAFYKRRVLLAEINRLLDVSKQLQRQKFIKKAGKK